MKQITTGDINQGFQPTRPRGARHICFSSMAGCCCFNPRAHAGRDSPTRSQRSHDWKFQPTRPRGARRAAADPHRQPAEVSTHAPTRGATTRCRQVDQQPMAFQPTRPRGARPVAIVARIARMQFQPTRPRGARRQAHQHGGRDAGSFNPRAHAGRDPILAGERRISTFQPTRPRGARPCARLVQPPPHAVSTHAPTRGATGQCCHRGGHLQVSTHAPTRGATARARRRRAASRSFNPRAHAGRDSTSKHARKRRRRFQPTRPRGARREALGVGRGVTVVSTHAPTRGATCTRMSRTAGLGKFQPTRPRGARLTVARPA